MSASPSQSLFETLDTWAAIERLIADGEAEGLYLECKAPASSQLTREQRAQLAEAASGFANTGGGVILWGVSTTRHAHSTLDVLTQTEPIGHSLRLAQEIDRTIPTLTTPGIELIPSRVLHERPTDRRGIVVTYIPPTTGDPVQSNIDRHFHFRNGDDFSEMPYDMLRRMFAGTTAPDLTPIFDQRIVTANEDGSWDLVAPTTGSFRGFDSRRLTLRFARFACPSRAPRAVACAVLSARCMREPAARACGGGAFVSRARACRSRQSTRSAVVTLR